MAKTDVREACLTQGRIDTHAHLGDTYSDLRDGIESRRHIGNAGALIGARVEAEGCRILYGRDVGAVLRHDVPTEVLDAATELRARGAWAAIEHALDTAGIEQQLAFCGHRPADGRPFADDAPPGRLGYLAYIDSAINGTGNYPSPDFSTLDGTYYGKLCEQLGPLNTLDDYLGALDNEIDQWRSHGVVGMKTAIAYTSGLAITNPGTDEARVSFARRNDMTEQDFRTVHDCAFHHVVRACKRNGLPVVIHTGYQIWGHADLSQSNPMLFHPVIVNPEYRDVTFVLLHGGNPYVGETTYLAGMFENVVIDFTWIGWMTPARFRLALAEWLACVPHDRMCFGSDSGTPETIVGIDSTMRRLMADVLDECVADRTIDERYALEFVENCYSATPKRVFGL